MLYAAIYVLINSDSFSFFFVIFTKSIIVSDGVIDLKKTYQRNLHCMFFIVFFFAIMCCRNLSLFNTCRTGGDG